MSNGITLYAQTISGLVIGIISFICSQLTFVPQLVSVLKTKNTSGISLIGYIAFTLCWTFWLIWSCGFYAHGIQSQFPDTSVSLELYQASITPVVITDAAGVFLMSSILAIKVRNVLLSKKLKVTELKLAEILLNKQEKKIISSGKNKFLMKNWSIILFIFIDLVIITTVTSCLALLTKTTRDGTDDFWVWLIVFNLLASLMGEVMAWLQFAKSIRSKDTSGISLSWTIFLPFVSCVTFTYNLYLAFATSVFEWYTIFGLIFNSIAANGGILIMKIINLVKAKKLGISEIELVKRYQKK